MEKKRTTCLRCGKALSKRQITIGNKFCSPTCYNKYRYERNPIITYTCIICNKELTNLQIRKRQLFCSNTCAGISRIGKPKIHKDSLYNYNINFFMDDNLFGYFIGFFLGDGNFSGTNVVTLGSTDKQIIEDIAKATKYTNVISKDLRENRKDRYIIGYTGPLARKFKLLGFNPGKKAHKIFIPACINNYNFSDLLRGYVDTDGCFSRNTTTHKKRKTKKIYNYLECSMNSICKNFLEQLHKKLLKMKIVEGGSVRLVRKAEGNRQDLFRLRFAHNDSLNIGKFIYYDTNVLCLQRKKNVFMNFMGK